MINYRLLLGSWVNRYQIKAARELHPISQLSGRGTAARKGQWDVKIHVFFRCIKIWNRAVQELLFVTRRGKKKKQLFFLHTHRPHTLLQSCRTGPFLMLQQMGQLYFLSGSLAQTLISHFCTRNKMYWNKKGLIMKKNPKNKSSPALLSKLTENRFLKVINGWPKDHKSTGTTKSRTFPCGPLHCQLHR